MQKTDTSELANVAAEVQSKTNLSEINPNIPLKVPRPNPVVETDEPIIEMTNALTAMNIEQWKQAIKDLHKMPRLSESWHMEQTNQTAFITIPLKENGQTISYE